MSRRFFLWATLVCAATSTGCAERAKVPSTSTTSQESSQAISPKVGTASDSPIAAKDEAAQEIKAVELAEANWSELQSFVAEQKGKVVVVDVWSTACEPCMKEFPHLITLQQKYPDDVVAISFDVDFAGIKNKPVSYYRERVLKFLGSQAENKVLHRMCNTPQDELHEALKLDSIPAVYVYGRDGALAKRFDGSNSGGGEVSYEKQISPFVDDLVK